MRTPKNWSRVSPRNLARVSNLWPKLEDKSHVPMVNPTIKCFKLKTSYNVFVSNLAYKFIIPNFIVNGYSARDIIIKSTWFEYIV